MAHIAFFVIPDAGHVNPTLGVVCELVARGHRVSYAITGEFAERVVAAGARHVDYTTTMMSYFGAGPAAPAGAERFSTADIVHVHRGRLEETVAILPGLATAFAGDTPDVVVYSPACWTGRLLAGRWQVPAIRSVSTFAANAQWSLGHGYAAFDSARPEVAALCGAVQRLLVRVKANLGLEEFFADDAGPAIVYIPRAFQYAGDSFSEDTHFVGPCVDRRVRPAHSWAPPDDGRPVLLVSLGTIFNDRLEFFRTCVEAFAGLPWNVILAVGDRVDPSGLGDLPPNVRAHRMIPQLEVLGAASVFVTHAGMRSVMESLHCGVPMVTIPQMPEQRANADRVVELGLGVRLDSEGLDPRTLRAAVESMSADDGVRRRIAQMRRRLQEAGGGARAANVIESMLTAPVPS